MVWAILFLIWLAPFAFWLVFIGRIRRRKP